MSKTIARVLLVFFATISIFLLVPNTAHAQEQSKFVDGEIIVKYKNGQSFIKLNEGVEQRSKNKKSIIGSLNNTVENLTYWIKGEKTPEEKLDTLKQIDKLSSITKHKEVFPERKSKLPEAEVITSSQKSTNELLKIYKVLPGVEYTQPNYILRAQQIPNDQFYPQMWNLKKIGAEEGWDITKGSGGVIVAVLDTGIDYYHTDLPTNIIKGRSFPDNNFSPLDRYGHGTHVAGTIGALTNNSQGVSGVNWNVRLMSVKVLDDNGSGYLDWVAGGIAYAADNGAKVINMSLGGSVRCSEDPLMQEAISYAKNNGVTVVAAAGNSNTDAANFDPASCNGVIAVAATGPTDQKSYYSNYGSVVDLAAPGGDVSLCGGDRTDWRCQIYSTYPRGQYKILQGTSMAAPHVSGAAALLLAQNYRLSPQDIEDILKGTGDSIPQSNSIGKRLNVHNALLAIDAGASPPPPLPTPTSLPTPTDFASAVKINNPSGRPEQWLTIPGSPGPIYPDELKTIEGWFYFDSLSISIYDQIILMMSPENWGLSVIIYSGKPTIFYSSYGVSNSYCSLKTSSTLEKNKWYHIAVSKSGNEISLYLNGKREDIKACQEVARFLWQPIYVGANANYPSLINAFSGSIDEIRISDTQRYSSDFTPQNSPFAVDDRTIALYHLDGNGQDWSGNQYNLQVNGNAQFLPSTLPSIIVSPPPNPTSSPTPSPSPSPSPSKSPSPSPTPSLSPSPTPTQITIDNISPSSASYGNEITINGQGFSPPGVNIDTLKVVHVRNLDGVEITLHKATDLNSGNYWSNNLITLRLPEIAPQTGKIKVYAGNSSAISSQDLRVTSNPSEFSRRIFVTSALYSGNLGGLSGADQKCQQRADNPDGDSSTNDGLGGNWKAWLSNNETSVESQLEHSSVLYKRLDGKTIANNWNDLTDGVEPSLYNPINITELGNAIPSPTEWNVWTNSTANGSVLWTGQGETCANWTTSNPLQTGHGGSASETNSQWTTSSLASKACNVWSRLYCLEQGASTPSPSPSPTSSPTGSPSPTPTPTPRAIGYALAETSTELEAIQEPTTRVESFPVTIDYTFSNSDPGNKILYVKFFYSDRTSQIKFSSLIYRPQTPSPSPSGSPSPAPTPSPEPTLTPSPTPTPSPTLPPSPSPSPAPIPGDANGDGVVDIVDYSILQGEFGKHEPPELRADFNNDGQVDIVDYSILVKNFGKHN